MNRKIGSILSAFTILLEIITALFLTPLIIKTLGQSQYGVYTLVLSISSYFALLDLGIGNSIIKFISKFRATGDLESQRKFLGVTTVYYIIIVFVIFIIGIVIYCLFPTFFSKGLSQEEIELGKKLFVLSTANIGVTIGTSGYLYTTIAYENFYISKGWPILTSLLRIIITFIFLTHNCSCYEILLIQFICNLITRFTNVVYVLVNMKIKPTLKNVDKKFIFSILSYSILILLQMIAAQINNATDQILLGALVSSSSVILGIYGVASQINHYYQTFGGVLNGVIMPGIVKRVEQDSSSESIQYEMTRIGRFNFMIVGIVYIVYLVFGKQFVSLWSGDENINAYYVALILMAPYVVILTQDVGLKFLWALDKQKIISIIKLVVVVINIVFTIILIKWNPLIGATIGTFISLFIGDIILMQIAFKKDLKIHLFGYYFNTIKGILPSLIMSLVVGYLVKLLHFNGIIGFLLNCSIMLITYLICLLIFGMNSYEKNLLKEILLKIRKKGD